MVLSDITIDKEIEGTTPKLTEEEFKQLEDNILQTGALDCPLIVYRDPETGEIILLDGHNRRVILLEHPEIEYTILEKEFTDRYEAIVWVCRNQLGRRNLTPENRVWLIGTAHDAQLKVRGGWHGNQYTKAESGKVEDSSNLPKSEGSAEKINTREKIESDFGATEWEVRQDVATTRAVKEADTIQPGFADKFRKGELEAKNKDIQKIAKVPEEEKADYVDSIYNNDVDRQAELGFGPKAPKPKKQSRYSLEEIENASKALEGFNNDPFQNLGEFEEAETETISCNEEAKVSDTGELGKAIDIAVSDFSVALRNIYESNKELLALQINREISTRKLSKGHEVVDKYLELFDGAEYAEESLDIDSEEV